MFTEMILSLRGLFVKFLASCEHFGQGNEEDLVHKSVLCLYAFIDTPVSKFIRKYQRYF